MLHLGRSSLQLPKVLQLLSLHELVDTFEVLGHFPAPKFVNLAHQSVKEVSVVRNEDECAIIPLECSLEDFLRLHIEVVRRFVEDQKVVGLQQEFQ